MYRIYQIPCVIEIETRPGRAINGVRRQRSSGSSRDGVPAFIPIQHNLLRRSQETNQMGWPGFWEVGGTAGVVHLYCVTRFMCNEMCMSL